MKRLVSTGRVNSPKPSAENATMTVLSVRICQSRANAASTEIGAGCASSMTSPRTSCFSNWPRGGSFSLNAKSATIATGKPSSTNGQRQPSSPPMPDAMPATMTGLSTPTKRDPMASQALMRPRTLIG